MNDFTLRTVTTYDEALKDPHAIVWMTDPSWDDVDSIPPELEDRIVVYTSSWQMGVFRTMGLGRANNRSFIVPQGTPEVRFRVPEYTDRLDIVWRGEDIGSAVMLATVASAIGLTEKNCNIKFFGNVDRPMLLSNLKKDRDVIIINFTEEQFNDALSDSHVFAYPSFRYHSQHLPTIQAAKAGCICVVPNHSGFREILGSFGAYIHHSRDNVEYAQALAEKLMVAKGALKDAYESTSEALNAMSSYATLTFSTKYQDNWMDSVKTHVSLKEVSRIVDAG